MCFQYLVTPQTMPYPVMIIISKRMLFPRAKVWIGEHELNNNLNRLEAQAMTTKTDWLWIIASSIVVLIAVSGPFILYGIH